MKIAVSSPQRRVGSVISALEEFLGIPEQSSRHADPLEMLVATILSQNTNDKNSDRAYRQLRKKFPSWDALLHAPVRSIASAIRVGGIARQKSDRIKKLLKHLHRQFGRLDLRFLRHLSDDEVYTFLTSLKGVGPKTAACVLIFALKRDVFPVDTHIHRICGRLGLVPQSRNAGQTYELMKPLVPPGKAYSFHINLIRFGRTLCRAQRPLCAKCPLYGECVFPRKVFFAEQPAAALKPGKSDFMLLQSI